MGASTLNKPCKGGRNITLHSPKGIKKRLDIFALISPRLKILRHQFTGHKVSKLATLIPKKINQQEINNTMLIIKLVLGLEFKPSVSVS